MTSSPSVSNTAAWRGTAIVLLAAVLWSTSGFFVKSPAFQDWPDQSRGLLLAFWRALFASALLAFFVRRVEWNWRLMVSAGCFAAMNTSYLTSMVYCEATLAIWLQYTSPIWVLLGGWWWFGEVPDRRERYPWLLLFAGVFVVILFGPGAGSWLGVFLGALSGFFFAGVVLSLRWLRGVDPAWVVLVNHLFTAILILPIVWWQGIWPEGWQQWSLLALFGGLQMGLPYVLFAFAIKHISSREASALLLLEPLFLPVWVYLAYHHLPDYQPPATAVMVGGGMILCGLAWRYALSRRVPLQRFDRS
jgi:drug/metabolite transporter (DMT)-like permease